MKKIKTLLDLIETKLNKYLKYSFRKKNNIIIVDPCYEIIDILNKNSIIVDFGTGNDADFSQALIKKYELTSYGFDPTKKHYPHLKELEKKLDKKFIFHNYALSNTKKNITFHESNINISGSFFDKHINIKRDDVTSYDVQAISIDDVFKVINKDYIDILKIDIEGEEYNVIESLSKSTTDKIGQIILEFHHHCIDDFDFTDTMKCIKKLQKFGYEVYSQDKINYLFFKNEK